MPHLTLNLSARQRKPLVSTLTFVVFKFEKIVLIQLFRLLEYKYCQSKLRLSPLFYRCSICSKRDDVIRATQRLLAPYLIITQSACQVSPKLVRNSISFHHCSQIDGICTHHSILNETKTSSPFSTFYVSLSPSTPLAVFAPALDMPIDPPSKAHEAYLCLEPTNAIPRQ